MLATMLIKSDAEGCLSLEREVSVVNGQPHVEITNTIDKRQSWKRGIHFGFAFDISDPVTRVDIPGELWSLKRPTFCSKPQLDCLSALARYFQ